jgi:hypothetical protein
MGLFPSQPEDLPEVDVYRTRLLQVYSTLCRADGTVGAAELLLLFNMPGVTEQSVVALMKRHDEKERWTFAEFELGLGRALKANHT